ncbi:hypothetical protein AVEN_47575-1 [Araneus ventricosus]|uniref:Uncharacterized protein n=1 Tax=Araneus ventricosus TaxID=182803 RepID=A0A4Y2DMC9_ARAVE|nr:hypothetical protein AVEN_47575-1 [Araneus ventricosus]
MRETGKRNPDFVLFQWFKQNRSFMSLTNHVFGAFSDQHVPVSSIEGSGCEGRGEGKDRDGVGYPFLDATIRFSPRVWASRRSSEAKCEAVHHFLNPEDWKGIRVHPSQLSVV